jgi:hypothetical protein
MPAKLSKSVISEHKKPKVFCKLRFAVQETEAYKSPICCPEIIDFEGVSFNVKIEDFDNVWGMQKPSVFAIENQRFSNM